MDAVLAATMADKKHLFSWWGHRSKPPHPKHNPARHEEHEEEHADAEPPRRQASDSDSERESESESKRESDVSGESEDEEVQERRSLVQLPSETEVGEIFEKLKNFNLKKIMAKEIVDPREGWIRGGGSRSSETANVLNPLDSELEMNIKALFDPEKFNIDSIKSTLSSYVNTLDKHTSTKSQRKKSTSDGTKRLKEFRNNVVPFYPHLLNAMKALMIYTEQNAKTKGIEKEVVYDKHAFRAWGEVYSYLKSIQSIISYVLNKEQINSDEFPSNFSVIIMQREKDLKLLQDVMMSQKERIQSMDRLILERDKKIAEINATYNGVDNQKMNLKAELSAIQSQIKSIDDPILIARQNQDIIKHFST
jgi:hypothetical protein